MEPGRALVKLIFNCDRRPEVGIQLDNLQMGGLRIGVVEWNVLHQNPQLIEFRSPCTDFTDPKKSVESLSLRDRIGLRTLNIIFGISELFWDSAQNLTLQTAIVRCRRHGKSSTYLSQGCNITDGRTGMGDDPATGQKKLLSHPSAATSEPLFSQALLAEQRTSNSSSPGTDPAWSWGAVDPELN